MTNFFQNLPIPKELRDALNSETATEDSSGGVSAAPRTAKFIVGNALNGDTLDVCDFLDPGNCTGIEAALAAGVALNGPFDVWLRPGDYDLTAVGAPTLPMRLPAVDFETLTPTCSIRSNRPPPAIVADSTLAVTSGARIIVGDDRTLLVWTNSASCGETRKPS